MIEIIKNEFSWSLQRFALFQRCKREYFYHYYGSWGGWEEAVVDKKIKLLYRLKNIKEEGFWLRSILEKSLSCLIKREIAPSLLSCKNFSIRAVYKDIFDIERKEYLKDSKKICLNTIYRGEETAASVRNRATANLDCFWNILWENSLFKIIREKRYGQFISIWELSNFLLENTKVWVNPSLVYQEKGKIFTVNIHPLFHPNTSPSPLYSSLSSLYISQTSKSILEEPIGITILVENNRCSVCRETLQLKKITELIKKSSSDMRSYLTINKKAYEENFPKTSIKEKCRACRFKETCTA